MPRGRTGKRNRAVAARQGLAAFAPAHGGTQRHPLQFIKFPDEIGRALESIWNLGLYGNFSADQYMAQNYMNINIEEITDLVEELCGKKLGIHSEECLGEQVACIEPLNHLVLDGYMNGILRLQQLQEETKEKELHDLPARIRKDNQLPITGPNAKGSLKSKRPSVRNAFQELLEATPCGPVMEDFQIVSQLFRGDQPADEDMDDNASSQPAQNQPDMDSIQQNASEDIISQAPVDNITAANSNVRMVSPSGNTGPQSVAPQGLASSSLSPMNRNHASTRRCHRLTTTVAVPVPVSPAADSPTRGPNLTATPPSTPIPEGVNPPDPILPGSPAVPASTPRRRGRRGRKQSQRTPASPIADPAANPTGTPNRRRTRNFERPQTMYDIDQQTKANIRELNQRVEALKINLKNEERKRKRRGKPRRKPTIHLSKLRNYKFYKTPVPSIDSAFLAQIYQPDFNPATFAAFLEEWEMLEDATTQPDNHSHEDRRGHEVETPSAPLLSTDAANVDRTVSLPRFVPAHSSTPIQPEAQAFLPQANETDNAGAAEPPVNDDGIGQSDHGSRIHPSTLIMTAGESTIPCEPGPMHDDGVTSPRQQPGNPVNSPSCEPAHIPDVNVENEENAVALPAVQMQQTHADLPRLDYNPKYKSSIMRALSRLHKKKEADGSLESNPITFKQFVNFGTTDRTVVAFIFAQIMELWKMKIIHIHSPGRNYDMKIFLPREFDHEIEEPDGLF